MDAANVISSADEISGLLLNSQTIISKEVPDDGEEEIDGDD